MDVLVDTNIILLPFKYGVDVFEEMRRLIPGSRFIMLKKQIDELKNVCRREKLNFNSVFGWLSKKVEFIDYFNKNVDWSLISYAKRTNAIIVSQDRDLKTMAKSQGLKVGTFRPIQKRFVLEDNI